MSHTGIVTDVYGEQIQADGQWFHAERLFGRPATTFKIGETIQALVQDHKPSAPAPDEYVDSDLFRESGANVSHTPEKIARFASAMDEYGGWGEFPMVAGRVVTIEESDLDRYNDYALKGWAHELTYSRPLTPADLGRRIVHLENGHNRSYAAASRGFKIPVFDIEKQELEYDKLSLRQASEKDENMDANDLQIESDQGLRRSMRP
jgi:hypothetical protein